MILWKSSVPVVCVLVLLPEAVCGGLRRSARVCGGLRPKVRDGTNRVFYGCLVAPIPKEMRVIFMKKVVCWVLLGALMLGFVAMIAFEIFA